MSREHSKTGLETAIQLLSRRDHGRIELFRKLMSKGFDDNEAEQAVQACEQYGYLDDVRYTQGMIRHHIAKGHGEQRIYQSLKQKQIDESIIAEQLAELDVDWFELATSTAQRKFGLSIEEPVKDPKVYAKQVRFLQYRGFNFEQIQYALNPNHR
ncbi:recombination regulator RecX [Vibrio gazogenes]|uniref:Regulatory protein RecX n=1 Tax=Vibrio gazogenes DSM 21264 = NBRC 103151 TaxID=1123492 RepID=A0A1M4WLG5_VIBGA|nr:recombination regulator RecX [Vibrio gazogenes]USP13193.1 recombination regulator RecX [Vibrio gazogenes]SHE82066.1 regulatory protein [Vibrio gazogenes DSM 21264] [Vibrio gazogenes DSM 21264 = NBRC 103151]SJN58947.1 Regulatory protein RecX [Vibrio gazogenes]